MVCLLEKGVEFEVVGIDLEAGKQKQSHFLSRQPFGQVPAVQDGDFRIFEYGAIIRYAAKYEDCGPNLLGKRRRLWWMEKAYARPGNPKEIRKATIS